jgi:hypothetical protein
MDDKNVGVPELYLSKVVVPKFRENEFDTFHVFQVSSLSLNSIDFATRVCCCEEPGEGRNLERRMMF